MNKLTKFPLAALLLAPLVALHAVDNEGVPATLGGQAGSPKAEANRVTEILVIVDGAQDVRGLVNANETSLLWAK